MNFLKRTGIWIASKVLPIHNEGITEWEKVRNEGKALREEIRGLSEKLDEPSDSDEKR